MQHLRQWAGRSELKPWFRARRARAGVVRAVVRGECGEKGRTPPRTLPWEVSQVLMSLPKNRNSGKMSKFAEKYNGLEVQEAYNVLVSNYKYLWSRERMN